MKPKKCKYCREPFYPARPLQMVCGYNCAVIYTNNQSEKKAKKDWQKEKEVRKEKLMTTNDYKIILQANINTIVRLIDKGSPCIATNTLNGKMNAGHYISVGANDTIRFHLDNIHLQSEHSNSFKSGDIHRYRDGIIRVYGQDYLSHMDSLKSIKSINLSIEDLKEIIKIAIQIKKELISLNEIYTPIQRLELRKKYNKQLNIYE
jgi:hypothetical protein